MNCAHVQCPCDTYCIIDNFMYTSHLPPPPPPTHPHHTTHTHITTQVNLDFQSEQDMVEKFRLGLALQPIATALFANSPFKEKKKTGYLSWRSHVWTDTDPDRCVWGGVVFSGGCNILCDGVCVLCWRSCEEECVRSVCTLEPCITTKTTTVVVHHLTHAPPYKCARQVSSLTHTPLLPPGVVTCPLCLRMVLGLSDMWTMHSMCPCTLCIAMEPTIMPWVSHSGIL